MIRVIQQDHTTELNAAIRDKLQDTYISLFSAAMKKLRTKKSFEILIVCVCVCLYIYKYIYKTNSIFCHDLLDEVMCKRKELLWHMCI